MSDSSQDWRLTPREQLFAPPRRDDAAELPRPVIASDQMMRYLASGRHINEEHLLSFASVLSDCVIGDEPAPLSGFGELRHALHADYGYYDASRHLEGFSEGALYGMVRLAEMLVDKLDGRSPRFLPGSVLDHPDVLLASNESLTMSSEKIATCLGISPQSVREAILDLGSERIVVQTIAGWHRHYFPSLRGERYAKSLRDMATDALKEAGGDIDKATDGIMGLSDFTDRNALRRMVSLVATGHGKPAVDRQGIAADIERKRKEANEKRRQEALGRLLPIWADGGTITWISVDGEGTSTVRETGSVDGLRNADIVTLLAIQEVLAEHSFPGDGTISKARIIVAGSCGLNAYEDDVTCDLEASDGRTAHIDLTVSGATVPSTGAPLGADTFVEGVSFTEHPPLGKTLPLHETTDDGNERNGE